MRQKPNNENKIDIRKSYAPSLDEVVPEFIPYQVKNKFTITFVVKSILVYIVTNCMLGDING